MVQTTARPRVFALSATGATNVTSAAVSVEPCGRGLGGMYRFIEEGRSERERWRVLDSFDGRLCRGGVVCLARAGQLELRSIRTMNVELSAPQVLPDGTYTPLLARALAQSPLRDRLLSLAGVRALLEAASHDVVVRRCRVVDDIEKTVAVVTLADGIAGSSLITVTPLRGYGAEVDRLCESIPGQHGLDTFAAALLAGSGARVSGDYSTRVRLALEPDWTCAEAMRAIVGCFSRVLEENTPGIVADWDVEFLHDYRVALRRLRTAVTLSRSVLTPEESDRMKSDLRSLELFTGPVRDLDVLLLHESDYCDVLPSQLQPGAERFFSLVGRRRAEACESLRQSMVDKARGTVLQRWEELGAGSAWPSGSAASRPVRRQARRWIGSRIGRIRAELARAEQSDDMELLHGLRLDCKKLRYLMEIYGSLFPASVVRPLTRDLREFQDTLGRLQDLAVQAMTLTDALEHIPHDGGDHVQIAASVGGILHELTRRRPELTVAFRNGVRPFRRRTGSPRVQKVFRKHVGGAG